MSRWKCIVPPPDIGKRVAVVVYNFRFVVFRYVQHCSSAEETTREQTEVCLFSPRFSLGFKKLFVKGTVQCMHMYSLTKHFPNHFNLFKCKRAYVNLVKNQTI